MQKSAKSLKPEEIIDIVIKRRWLIIIPFCLSMLAGIYLSFTLPKIYSAETLILVEPQRVPTDYVHSIVATDIESRIRTIKEQVMSRTNLEKIINQFNLFPEPKYKNMYMEDKIKSVVGRISLRVTSAGRRQNTDSFSISYKDKDPEKVMRIANALASYFIDENLKAREIQALGTSSFLDEELNSIRKELVAQELKLKEYREKYMGGLPEQLESNLRILDRLQEQLNTRQVSLADARNRLAMIKSQISEDQRMPSQSDSLTNNGQVSTGSEESLTPNQARARLAYLETRYTEKHPDIIRIKKIISEFEKKNVKDDQETSEELQYIPANMRMQLGEITAEIKTCEEDISNLNAQIRTYQARVENTPKKEQELLSLERDYDNIKASYNSLLNRKLEADIAVNMEKKQKGEQFRIIDPARLPQKPVSPDMKKLFLILAAAGFGIGGGIIFLLEYFNTSFRSPEDIESYLGFTVMATVPVIYHRKDEWRKKLNQAFSILSIMISFFLFVVFAMISFKGVDLTMALENCINLLPKCIDILIN
jgi:protein tyrosine kinase modulator